MCVWCKVAFAFGEKPNLKIYLRFTTLVIETPLALGSSFYRASICTRKKSAVFQLSRFVKQLTAALAATFQTVPTHEEIAP